MKVAVLGAGGMLGRELVSALGQAGDKVAAATRSDCDVADLGATIQFIRQTQPELVINAAAYTDVDGAQRDVDVAYRINAMGARNVAVAAASVGASVLYVSSDYVFDGAKGSGYDEFDSPNPLSVYGRSKCAGEVLTRTACPRCYVVRSQWLYGPGGRNFVDSILRLARERPRLEIVDDQFGSPTYTADLAAAIVTLVREPAYGTYHLTNGGVCSWFDFAREVLAQAGIEGVAVHPVSTAQLGRPAPRPPYSPLDNLMWRLEGREPRRHYREALEAYLKAKA